MSKSIKTITIEEHQRLVDEAVTKSLGEFKTSMKEKQIDKAIEKCGSHNSKMLKSTLDMDKISFEDGVLIGFDEQIEQAKKENSFLFPVNKINTGGGGNPSGTVSEKDDPIREAMNL